MHCPSGSGQRRSSCKMTWRLVTGSCPDFSRASSRGQGVLRSQASSRRGTRPMCVCSTRPVPRYRSGVSSREVARVTGRTYHPQMQWLAICPTKDGSGQQRFSDPMLGQLPSAECKSLFATLADWTSTPDVCWMGIWEGNGSLYAPSGRSVAVFTTGGSPQEEYDADYARMIASWKELAEALRRIPTFDHPGRSYFLAEGPSTAICALDRFPLSLTPNLVWPDDRSWCVASEIDFDSTLVAASKECATALLESESLEAAEVGPEDRLDISGDSINPPVSW